MKLLLLLFNFQRCSPDILKEKLSQRTTAFQLRQSDSVTVVRLVLMTFFSLPGFSSHSLSFIPGVIEAQLDTGAAGGVNAECLVTPSSSSYTQTNYCSLEPAVSFSKSYSQ